MYVSRLLRIRSSKLVAPCALAWRRTSQNTTEGLVSSRGDSKCYAAVAAATAAAGTAAACLGNGDSDLSACEKESILWVDVYGKKVPVHEKVSESSPQPGVAESSRPDRFYPYVILGHGVAGRAALEALVENDPGAKVLVVDARVDAVPSWRLSEDESSTLAQERAQWRSAYRNVDFASGVHATALDADRGTIRLVDARSSEGLRPEEVAFGRCLLALGSRARGPPQGFVDSEVEGDVNLLGSHNGLDREGLKREVAEGRAVTIVGSSWQALELACWLQEGREHSERPGVCRMVFPDFAPLDHILPRYLSVALIRRLNRRHIKTIGHSSIRWIGPAQAMLAPPPQSIPLSPEPGESENMSPLAGDAVASSGPDDVHREGAGLLRMEDVGSGDTRTGVREEEPTRKALKRRKRRLHVMTAHSFDHLDTAMHSADKVVLAGVDVAPLDEYLDLEGSAEGNGAVGMKNLAGSLEVDARRGAVVVNSELAASSRVWCAGDVACYPSSSHRGSRRVLRTADHAHHSGKLAGENMAAAAHGLSGQRYRHRPAFVGEAPLAGVRVAMIGDCDAAMTTHGFWWTNSATGLMRKATAPRLSNEREEQDRDRPHASGVTLRSRRTVRKEFTPVLGTGVVFYTVGPEVKGALLWGFPGEATTAAAMRRRGSAIGEHDTPADEAAGISARALDLLRHIMERSASMEADLNDERIIQAWLQGLTDAARALVHETGLGHLQPMRRSVPGRVTSSTRRPPGTRDELMFQNTFKTSSAQRRLRAAYSARFRGVEPQAWPTYSTGIPGDGEFEPENLEFLGYGSGPFDAARDQAVTSNS